MARKKKKKKADPEKAREAGKKDPATPAAEGDGGESRKPKSKKKRIRKKAAKGASRSAPKRKPKRKPEPEPVAPPAEGPVEAVEGEAAPVEDVEAEAGDDLDADVGRDAEAVEDVDALIARVAVMDQEVEWVEAAPEALDDDVVEPENDSAVEDLDAVLDDDLDGSEDLERLIAQTVAGAVPEDAEEKSASDALHQELVEVLDAAPPSSPAVGAAAAARAAASLEDEIDLTGAIDLGPISSPEVRDRLLAQALAHAEQKDARYRVPFSDPRRAARWKGAVAAVLIILASAVLVAPPQWVRPEPPARLDAPERARGIRQALLLQAQQVDAYRVRHQRLPQSLDELPYRLPGLRLVTSGNRAYQLIGYQRDGNAIVYDSAEPESEFGRLTPSLLAPPNER